MYVALSFVGVLIRYQFLFTDSEHDVDKLIEKTEQEGDEKEGENGSSASAAFSFAKVWSADKDALEDMADEKEADGSHIDAWTQALERLAAERKQAQADEVTGRGVRRKAAAVFAPQVGPILAMLICSI